MLTAKEAYKMANENCNGTRLNILNKIDKIIRDAVENQLFFVQYDIENGKEARVAYQVVNTLKNLGYNAEYYDDVYGQRIDIEWNGGQEE